MNRTRYIIIIVMVCCAGICQSQDRTTLNSQYIFNGLLLNPAFAGRNEVLAMTFSHRRQWMGFEGAPKTFVLSLHAPLKNKKIALGLLLQSEDIGLRSYSNVFANYAYRIALGNGKLSMGLKAGVSFGKFGPIDLGNGEYVFDDKLNNYVLPNFGLGIYYYAPGYFVGLSVPLILGYEDGGEDTGLRIYHDFSTYSYYLTAGYTYPLNAEWKIQPCIMLNYEKSYSFTPDINVNVIYRDFFTGGLSYRLKEAFIFLINYRIAYQTRVGISYDFGLGELSNYHHGSLEFTVQYVLGYRVNAANPGNF